MESETGENKDAAFLKLQQNIEVQAALLSRLRDENSDLRKQLGETVSKYNVTCKTASDFREYNTQLKQELQEVEAHLAMVLDAREQELDRHNAETELLQQEQEQKNNELIKQLKLLQKKTSGPRSAEAPTHSETICVACNAEAPTCSETIYVASYVEASTCTEQVNWKDAYAQTESDAALFPLRVAARKLQEGISKAENEFRAAIAQRSDRWGD